MSDGEFNAIGDDEALLDGGIESRRVCTGCAGCKRPRNFLVVAVIGVVVAIVAAVIIVGATGGHVVKKKPPTAVEKACSVFCYGRLLETVQMNGIFNDSKTFVDSPMLMDADIILNAFEAKFPKNKPVDHAELKRWVMDTFGEAGSDVDRDVVPPDHQKNPFVVAKQRNSTLKQFASDLNDIWPQLYGQVNKSVYDYPERHSLLPLKRPFVLPGGRFRETYFWDSYWILKGLLACNMSVTGSDLVENLIFMSEMLGVVPNGARVYYQNRSQPPVLTDMMLALVEVTGNTTLLKRAAAAGERELEHFTTGSHALKTGDGTLLSVYAADTGEPRPEGFVEDYSAAVTAGLEPFGAGAQMLYRNIRAAAESGWDFSSRWLRSPDSISSAMTMSVVPVELYSHLCRLEGNLAQIYTMLNDPTNAQKHQSSVNQRKTTLKSKFFNPTLSIWTDLIQQSDGSLQPSKIITPSSFAPLWSPCYTPGEDPTLDKAIFQAFQNTGLFQPGGILTSLNNTGQQWDAPNAWPPLVWWTIHALQRLDATVPEAGTAANNLARLWVDANLIGYNTYGDMAEKWNAYIPGRAGGGGEYPGQKGFGWTNGVVLDILANFDF